MRSNGPTGPYARRPIGQVAQYHCRQMTDEPRPTPEEEDAPLERRQEEDATRGPAHEDPEETLDPDPEAE